ncbi:oligosaccharide repeat unit polymerase [Inquilinus limosus]|uniref:O-antigen polymerase n=1 Tax=Inquilinus limosus TaxID=171674 RepID=UPI003F15F1A9
MRIFDRPPPKDGPQSARMKKPVPDGRRCWHSPVGPAKIGTIHNGVLRMTRFTEHSLINPRSLTPVSVLLWMCLAWLAIFWVAPVEMYASASNYPYVLLGVCLAALLGGLMLFEPKSLPTLLIDRDDEHQRLRLLYKVAFVLGILGIFLRVADWVFLRGLTIDTEFMENREKIETAGANAFSMASTMLVPFTVVPYMLYAVARRNGVQVGRTWTSVGLALLWPLLTIVIGSRSSMFMSIGMLAIARLIIFRRTSKLAVAAIVLGFVSLIYLGGLLFIARLTEIGLKVEGVIKFSAFTHLVPVTNEYYHFTSTLTDWQNDSTFIATTFSQYILHGVPEFIYLVEHYTKGDQWGLYGFPFFPRLLSALWGVGYDANSVVFSVPRAGIYTTMFGPFYVDFGPIAPAFCLALGGFISFIRKRVLQGDVAALPLYITFVMQVASAVVVNTFLAAYGIFFNLAFICFWIGVTILRPRSTKQSTWLAQEARP